MTHKSGALAAWLAGQAEAFEGVLGAILSEGGAHRSPRLAAAMRHAVLAGGKRLRPYLVIESARLFGLEGEGVSRVAAALEFIHCYSLAHDDLPAMDNDDIRRGKPTVHKAFDEATAILAGDGLLTLAFSVLADQRTARSSLVRMRLIAALAQASGIDGMVGGQMLDLEAEGRFDGAAPKRLDQQTIERLQGLKTGALIGFAAEAGALMAVRAGKPQRRALQLYGQALGLAFQIRDDLIDIEVDAATAGKATGKDSGAGKGTFVSLLGIEGARRHLARTTDAGIAALAPFGEAATPLVEVMAFNRTRLA